MIIELTDKEVTKAIELYMSRDVLDICGSGFKGTVKASQNANFDWQVELILPENLPEASPY